jgi:hypothetical protein
LRDDLFVLLGPYSPPPATTAIADASRHRHSVPIRQLHSRTSCCSRRAPGSGRRTPIASLQAQSRCPLFLMIFCSLVICRLFAYSSVYPQSQI